VSTVKMDEENASTHFLEMGTQRGVISCGHLSFVDCSWSWSSLVCLHWLFVVVSCCRGLWHLHVVVAADNG